MLFNSQSPVHSVARLAHEVHRTLCAEVYGDTSIPAWENATPAQRDFAVQGVQEISQNPEITPEQSHAAWVKRMTRPAEYKKKMDPEKGWVDDLDKPTHLPWTRGPKKDLAKRVHPDLVPYAELPEQQRVKDRFFFAVVKTFLGAKP